MTRCSAQVADVSFKITDTTLESADRDQCNDQQDGDGQYRQADQDQYPRQIIHRVDFPVEC